MVGKTHYTTIQQNIIQWYDKHGRKDLPWRITNDPYAVYLSEVMLQQTQVKTVLERFYFPFLAQFPTIKALALAPQDAVLKQWEGLGYYNRCKNLHAAAKILQGQGGFSALHNLPTDVLVERLIALPGVGQNTAHAVAAFVYQRPVPVMEANLKRVLARYFTLSNPTEQLWWQKAHALLDHEYPFEYNQAMMDIGATICTKTKPKCEQCPLYTTCEGKIAPELYPAIKKKKSIPIRKKVIICFKNQGGDYYLAPRSSRFLHGLYGFCEYGCDDRFVFQDQEYSLNALTVLGQVTQSYSHFRLEADIYAVETSLPEGGGWYTLDEVKALPLSKADQKIAELL